MKKILLSMVACLAAFAVNAGTIYLVGSGTVDGKTLGGSPDGNCVAVTSSTNVYKFTVNNIGWLKISDTNATDWPTFNKNGWTIDGKGDYALSAADLGKTFNLWYSNGSSEGTNNINPPSSDEYTYTLTVGDKGASNSTLVVTANSDVQITYEIYLRGDMNGWGTDSNYKFTAVDGDSYELKNVTMSKGVKFKVADANWGSINYGGAGNVNANTSYTLTYNGNDLTLNQDIANATVKFTLSTATLYIDDENADPDVPVLPDYSNVWLHVGGAFNGYDFYNGGINPNEEGIATFNNLAIGTSGFKVHIWTAEDGDVYYIMDDPDGGTEVPTGEWVQYVIDGYDMYNTVAGATEGNVYNINFNFNTKELYVTLADGGDTPIDPTPDPTLPDVVYLMGNVNEGGWAPDYGIEAVGNEGVYEWTNVVIGDEYNGNGYFSFSTKLGADWDADGPNTSNRYGAVAGDTPVQAGGSYEVVLYAVGVDASSCAAWMAPAGTYDFTLDLVNNTLKVSEGDTNAVSSINVENGAPVFYNLQGMKVANPEKGLYIKVVNGKASKVML